MGNPFRSFGNVPIVGQADRPMTAQEMAADLAEETCLELLEMRKAALAAEAACEPSLPSTPRHKELRLTLESLMKGVHAWVVAPIILEHFPEMAAPPSDEEKAAFDRYMAEVQALKK